MAAVGRAARRTPVGRPPDDEFPWVYHTRINTSLQEDTHAAIRRCASETELDSLEYVRIAVIEGQTKGVSQSSMSALRKKAGELCASAILLLQSEMVPGVPMTTVLSDANLDSRAGLLERLC